MTEYIHLVGAEQVQRAASSISASAEQMQRAADSIAESQYRFQQTVQQAIEDAAQLVYRLEQLKVRP